MNARRPPLVAAVVSTVMAVVLLFAIDRLRGQVTARLFRVKEQTDVYALPPPAYVQRAALGYDDAVVAILWASTLYQYGQHVGQNRRFPYASQYLRTILHLDPSFRPAYKFAGTLVTMQAAAPEREELEVVRSLLSNGTEVLPNDADVWGAYASFMMFEGAQFLSDREKTAWRTVGASAAQRAVELGYFMDNLNLTGAIYLERAGHRELAIKQLERAYAVAPNDETRERIVAKLERLQGSVAIERVRRAQRLFSDRWRDEAPFLDEAPFAVLGPRRDVSACAGLVGETPLCDVGWAGAVER